MKVTTPRCDGLLLDESPCEHTQICFDMGPTLSTTGSFRMRRAFWLHSSSSVASVAVCTFDAIVLT
eukprot:9477334-Pyramimonas_sp.AAC.1